MNGQPRFGFAGDRKVAASVLKYLISAGARPLALLVPSAPKASHAGELRRLCGYLPTEATLEGRAFREGPGRAFLSSLQLDYLICVHFPYFVPREVLQIPTVGCVNLHPALLPFNRGWHTPSWAILDGTPAGATLHFMDEGIDTGDIIHQRQVPIRPEDTAHSLYERILEEEVVVFREAWPALVARTYVRRPQRSELATVHRREDLSDPSIQELQLDEKTSARALLDRLRGLTTNRLGEACYFDQGGGRYRVQVSIVPESTPPESPHQRGDARGSG